MSVLTGIAPQAILDLDPVMYDAMVEALGGRWSVGDEFAASALEIQHAIYVSGLAQGGVKNLPEPLKIPRPGEIEKKPRILSVREFASLHGTGGK